MSSNGAAAYTAQGGNIIGWIGLLVVLDPLFVIMVSL